MASTAKAPIPEAPKPANETAPAGPTGPEAEEHIEHHHMETAGAAATSATPAQAASYSRVVVIALDASPSSEFAFQWALDNFIRKDQGDLVVLTTTREPVLVPGSYGAAPSLNLCFFNGSQLGAS